MKKIYYLKTCDTCKRILKQINIDGFELINIKEHHISKEDLELAHKETGSYEALFNKRAQKYKQQNLKDQNLTEQDFKTFILQEYTFLKRPLIINGNDIFIGNDKKTVERLIENLS